MLRNEKISLATSHGNNYKLKIPPPHATKLIIYFSVIIFTLLFTTCFNPLLPNEGNLTFVFNGNNPRSIVPWPPANGETDISDEIIMIITLAPQNGGVSFNVTGRANKTITTKVQFGTYHVIAKAYFRKTSDDTLYAVSDKTYIVDILENESETVYITMVQFQELFYEEGTAEYPFRIDNESELRKVGTGRDGWTMSAHYLVTKDIDLTGEWIPIGYNSSAFNGVFDGGGFTISNLYFNKSALSVYESVGLFQHVWGTVKNVVLDNVNITANNGVGAIAGGTSNTGRIENCSVISGTIKGTDYVGGLVGGNEGTILNSNNEGVAVTAYHGVGGISGFNHGTISDCYNYGNVTGGVNNPGGTGNSDSSGNNAGGISGNNFNNFDPNINAKIINSHNAGIVTGVNHVGGIIGSNSVGEVDNCINNGNVTGSGYQIGGIAGTNLDTVKNCNNTGEVTSSGQWDVGGIVGRCDGTISDCSNIGDINSSATCTGGIAGSSWGAIIDCDNSGIISGSGDNIGGLVGYSSNTGTVLYCFNTSNVTSTGDYNAGGIVGKSDGTISFSFNNGEINGNTNVGGIAGGSEGLISNCYNTGDIIGRSDVGGIAGISLNNSIITNNYNTGNINGSYDNTGGIVGFGQNTDILNNYNTGNVLNNGYNGGGIVGWYDQRITVSNNVSLGLSVTVSLSTIGRVVGGGYGSIFRSNNYARDDMAGSTWISNINGNDGQDINDTNWGVVSWWTTAGNWNTAAWDTTIWDFSNVSADSLPILRGMPGETQNPEVPF